MYQLAANISYLGYNYYGWQKQSHTNNTIQHHIEYALSKIANEPIQVSCAGRTDSGVHATNQIIHFKTNAYRKEYAWFMGANTYLPKEIRINYIAATHPDFHARFSAFSRRYHYLIEDNSHGNAILNQLVTKERLTLNTNDMNQAAQSLIGEQDFSSFRASHCQSKTPFRHIDFVSVKRQEKFILIDIQANAFLYHMVRNIVGALLEVGKGKKTSLWFIELLKEKNRNLAPPTAPANGLYLVGVGYPKNLLNDKQQYTPCPLITAP